MNAMRDSLQLDAEQQFGVGDETYVCHKVGLTNSKGVWLGDDPLDFSLPLFILQLSVIFICTRSISLLLKPFGQPSIVSKILVSVKISIALFSLLII